MFFANAARRFSRFFNRNMLVTTFVLMIGFGVILPAPGTVLGNVHHDVLSKLCIMIVFFCNGFKLDTEQIQNVQKQWLACIWGATLILLITSLIGVYLTQEIMNLSFLRIPHEFFTGFQIMFAGPTVINSGIVLTEQARGEVSLALFLTIVTNVIGVFLAPVLVKRFVDFNVREDDLSRGVDANVKLDAGNLLMSLLATCFVPLFLGKLLSFHAPAKAWSKRHCWWMTFIPIMVLAFLPFMRISKAKSDGAFDHVSFQSLLFVVIWAAILVLLLFCSVYGVSKICFQDTVVRTLAIEACQKNLSVSLTIISFLPKELGSPGILSIPSILTHLTQVFILAILVKKWQKGSGDDQLQIQTSHATVEMMSLVPQGGLGDDEDPL